MKLSLHTKAFSVNLIVKDEVFTADLCIHWRDLKIELGMVRRSNDLELSVKLNLSYLDLVIQWRKQLSLARP